MEPSASNGMRMRVAGRLVTWRAVSSAKDVITGFAEAAREPLSLPENSHVVIADSVAMDFVRTSLSQTLCDELRDAITLRQVVLLYQESDFGDGRSSRQMLHPSARSWRNETELRALLDAHDETAEVVSVLSSTDARLLRWVDRHCGSVLSWALPEPIGTSVTLDYGGACYEFRESACLLRFGLSGRGSAIASSSVHGAPVRGVASEAWAGVDIEEMFLPAPVAMIGPQAFAKCVKLHCVVLPSSLRCIGPGAFSDCTALERVDIPDGVTSIGDEAFAGCAALRRASLPRELVELDKSAFDRCSPDLTLVVHAGSYAHRWAISAGMRFSLVEKPPREPLLHSEGFVAEPLDDGSCALLHVSSSNLNNGVLEVPDRIGDRRVSVIASGAFHRFEGLVSVKLPRGVERVLPGAFRDCPDLSEVVGLDENATVAPSAFDPRSNSAALSRIRATDSEARIRLTPRMICALLGEDLPVSLHDSADDPVSVVSGGRQALKADCAYAVRAKGPLAQEAARAAWSKRKVRFFIAVEQITDSAGRWLPTLVVPKPSIAFLNLMEWMKAQYSALTVAVTGSVGKTTTKEMIGAIAAERGPTIVNHANLNGALWVGAYVQRLRHDTAMYIQEVGAQYPGSVARSAKILRPDAFVIMNIGLSHVENYGTIERTLEEKLSLDRFLSPAGTAFVNFDDERLRASDYRGRVVSFGVHSRDVDFFADEIRQTSEGITFRIVEPSSGDATRIAISAIGEHNAYNALAAFAVGRWIGVDASAIVEVLAKFRSEGLRQNLIEVDGRKVYVDCYNASLESIRASVRAFQRVPVPRGARHVYVVGDILELGEVAESVHRDVGRDLAEQDGIDLFVCYGEHAAALSEEIVKRGKRSLHTEHRSELVKFLREHIGPNDAIAFKASNGMNLGSVVDELFGTRLSPRRT